MNKKIKFLLIVLIILIGIIVLNYKNIIITIFSQKSKKLNSETEKEQSFTTAYTPDISHETEDVNNSTNIELNYNRSIENVTIEVLEDTISRDGVTVVITDNNEDQYGWGEDYIIERKDGDEWQEIEPTKSKITRLIAYKRDEKNQVTFNIKWNEYYGSLEDGIYRIGKNAGSYQEDNLVYSEEFEIK